MKIYENNGYMGYMLYYVADVTIYDKYLPMGGKRSIPWRHPQSRLDIKIAMRNQK